MEATAAFLALFSESLQEGFFVKLTLSKRVPKTATLQNVYGRLILIKGTPQLSLTYRYATQDVVKNVALEQAVETISAFLGSQFLIATLRTTRQDLVLQYNKKRRARLQRQQPSIRQVPSLQHNQAKQYLIEEDAPFLERLGIAKDGRVLKAHQDKYRQINKYVEIMAGLLAPLSQQKPLRIVDMGSGKGYLTFALAHYLQQQGCAANITGIELREALTQFCNEQAAALGWTQLRFVAQDIATYDDAAIDVLIALHACNTATDLALAKGIQAQAQVLVVAPCCHRQVRQALPAPADAWQGVLKHGILLERQAELLTDGIRALLLEASGYHSKVFEFISSEHTAKNLMITGVRAAVSEAQRATAWQQIAALKATFGLDEHYLERLLA